MIKFVDRIQVFYSSDLKLFEKESEQGKSSFFTLYFGLNYKPYLCKRLFYIFSYFAFQKKNIKGQIKVSVTHLLGFHTRKHVPM